MNASFRLAGKTALLALTVGVACGGLSSRSNGSLASVNGRLTGDVPSNARIALVWHKATGGLLVGTESSVTGGAFSINLAGPPPEETFFDNFYDGANTSSPPSAGGVAPAPVTEGTDGNAGGGSSGSAKQLHTLGGSVSGTVSPPLTAAIAGFVIYADQNGNGHLDLTSDDGQSPDEILGGSRDVALVYLRDGTDLDLEKMRDKSGQLPVRGYGMAALSTERWLPLTNVQLTLGVKSLPNAVCQGPTIGGDVDPGASPISTEPLPEDASAGTDPAPSGGGSAGNSYPKPGDPYLHCSADGRSFTYGSCWTTTPTPPPPPALCATYVDKVAPCAESGAALPAGVPVPADWPCPVDVTGGADGGTLDAGSADPPPPPSTPPAPPSAFFARRAR